MSTDFVSVCFMLPCCHETDVHIRLIWLWFYMNRHLFWVFLQAFSVCFVLKISKTLFPHLKPSVCSTGGAGQPDVGRRQHCFSSAPGHHEARLLGRPHHLPHLEAPQDEQVRVRHHAAGRPPVSFLRATVATRRRINIVSMHLASVRRARRRAPRTSCRHSSPPWKRSEPKLWRSSPTASRWIAVTSSRPAATNIFCTMDWFNVRQYFQGPTWILWYFQNVMINVKPLYLFAT